MEINAIDPKLVPLACRLANCQPQDLLHVLNRGDSLVVILTSGAKHVFTAEQMAHATEATGREHTPRVGPISERELSAAVDQQQLAGLKAVAAAHPGELAAAEHNAPPHAGTPQTHVWPGDIQDKPAQPATFPRPPKPKHT